MELIKTFDQYPHKWSFFQLHNPSPFLLGGNRVSENAVLVKWVISFCLGGEFYLEEWGSKGCKDGGTIKTCDQYPYKLVIFSVL